MSGGATGRLSCRPFYIKNTHYPLRCIYLHLRIVISTEGAKIAISKNHRKCNISRCPRAGHSQHESESESEDEVE